MRISYKYLIPAVWIIFLPLLSRADDREFPGMCGWHSAGEIRNFTPETLFDFINGASETYISYAFRHLKVKEYTKKSGAEIKVEIYEHADEKNAFGIYSIERAPEYLYLEIGAEAYRVEDVLNMVCGKYYVKMEGRHLSSRDYPDMEKLARRIARRLDKHAVLPAILSEFPDENRLDHSAMYAGRDFLGFEFLKNAFSYLFQVRDTNFQLFVIDAGKAEKSEEMLLAYLDFTGQDKGILEDKFIVIHDRYNGDIQLVWDGRYIIGAVNCDDEEVCRVYLVQFLENLIY